MKKLIALLLVLAMALSLVACGAKAPAEAPKTEESKTEESKTEAPKEDTKKEEPKVEENLTATQKIIKEAESMTLEELAKKAI